MKVSLYYRKPNPTNWSIEFIFQTIYDSLKNQIDINQNVSPFYSRGMTNRIKSILWIKRQGKDADIHHMTGDTHFFVLGLPSGKTILTIHDLSFLKRGSWASRFFLWFFWVILPVSRAKYITCVSEETRKEILKLSFCKKEKIRVIYNFLRKEFQPSDKKFNSDSPVLLQIGTNYNKNLERLVAALKGISCRLRIIGFLSDRTKDKLEQCRISYTNVWGLNDSELRREYMNADIITFCSTMEGFGLPIIEGQAVGRAVVTSNLSSMPEIAGNGACFVDPFSEESIRAGILKVIHDTGFRNAIIQRGFKNAQRFSIDKVVDQYKELYVEIFNRNEQELSA